MRLFTGIQVSDNVRRHLTGVCHDWRMHWNEDLLGLSDRDASIRLWAALDRRLVDRAIWAPLVNARIVDFVSDRLRGYQSSPIYHFLPAQAWVAR